MDDGDPSFDARVTELAAVFQIRAREEASASDSPVHAEDDDSDILSANKPDSDGESESPKGGGLIFGDLEQSKWGGRGSLANSQIRKLQAELRRQTREVELCRAVIKQRTTALMAKDDELRRCKHQLGASKRQVMALEETAERLRSDLAAATHTVGSRVVPADTDDAKDKAIEALSLENRTVREEASLLAAQLRKRAGVQIAFARLQDEMRHLTNKVGGGIVVEKQPERPGGNTAGLGLVAGAVLSAGDTAGDSKSNARRRRWSSSSGAAAAGAAGGGSDDNLEGSLPASPGATGTPGQDTSSGAAATIAAPEGGVAGRGGGDSGNERGSMEGAQAQHATAATSHNNKPWSVSDGGLQLQLQYLKQEMRKMLVMRRDCFQLTAHEVDALVQDHARGAEANLYAEVELQRIKLESLVDRATERAERAEAEVRNLVDGSLGRPQQQAQGAGGIGGSSVSAQASPGGGAGSNGSLPTPISSRSQSVPEFATRYGASSRAGRPAAASEGEGERSRSGAGSGSTSIAGNLVSEGGATSADSGGGTAGEGEVTAAAAGGGLVTALKNGNDGVATFAAAEDKMLRQQVKDLTEQLNLSKEALSNLETQLHEARAASAAAASALEGEERRARTLEARVVDAGEIEARTAQQVSLIEAAAVEREQRLTAVADSQAQRAEAAVRAAADAERHLREVSSAAASRIKGLELQVQEAHAHAEDLATRLAAAESATGGQGGVWGGIPELTEEDMEDLVSRWRGELEDRLGSGSFAAR